MADITKCCAKNCPYRGRCLRYTAPNKPWQSYADFSIGRINKKGKCDTFIPLSK